MQGTTTDFDINHFDEVVHPWRYNLRLYALILEGVNSITHEVYTISGRYIATLYNHNCKVCNLTRKEQHAYRRLGNANSI